MKEDIAIGIDLAKTVFALCCMNRAGKVLWRKKVRREKLLEFFANIPACLALMEACGGSHYWARKLERYGHRVKIIPPEAVTPYRRRGKNDMNDAEAICEAGMRPNMSTVAVKSEGQQDLQAQQRVRERLIKERTALANEIRGLLAEYGVVIRKGVEHIKKLPMILELNAAELTSSIRETMSDLYEEFVGLNVRIERMDKSLARLAEVHPIAKVLTSIPGVGPVTSMAMIAAVSNPRAFKNGRMFSAWIGLIPRQNSTGGEARLGTITKRGNTQLRRLLVCGAQCLLRICANREERLFVWAAQMKKSKGTKCAAVAVAAKLARICWAVLASEKRFDHAALIPGAA